MKKNVIKNVIMLYGMTFAKLIFPLLTLPYLTRRLAVDTYGKVAYVKSLMNYFQVMIDFGFMLSGTKEIVKNRNDKKKIGEITGDIIAARIIIAILCFLILLGLIIFLPILHEFKLYTILSYGTVFLSIFLLDYLFRGLERMEIITIRYITMRGITTLLTFILIRDDTDVLLIPVLDLLGTVIAIFLVIKNIKIMDIPIRLNRLRNALNKIKESFVFFASNMATTIFGALNTIIIGAVLKDSDVAFWSVCIQIIGAVQTLYTPITEGLYPEMIKSKNIRLIRNISFTLFPILFGGAAFSFIFSPMILQILAGENYNAASTVFRCLTPVLIFSFYSILFGWPALGAINREKEVTFSTIVSAIIQAAGLLVLLFISQFGIIQIALLRSFTEMVLMSIRGCFLGKYSKVT